MTIFTKIAKIATRQLKQYNLVPPLALAAMVTVFSAGLLLRVDGLEETHLRETQRREVLKELEAVRSRLELGLTGPLLRTLGVAAYIAARGDISSAEFDSVARVLLEGHRNIKDMVLSRGTVIKMIYPLEENRRALGVDYRDQPRQWPSVQRAIETRKPVMNGPVPLVQGGTGLIVRHPIFVPGEGGSERFFGIVSVVLDLPGIFADAGIGDRQLPIELGIRGGEGDVIYGAKGLFAGDAVEAEVVLPYGSWQLAAEPKGGWSDTGLAITRSRTLAGLLFILIAAASFGSAGNIIQNERTRKTLLESEERFRATFEQAAVGIVHASFEGQLLRSNKRFADILGYTLDELKTMHYRDFTHPDDAHMNEDAFQLLVDGKEENVLWEKRYLRKHGPPVWARVRLSLRRDASGTPLHLITVVEDISERKAAEAEIERLAFYDILTGLPNRRLFLERLTRAKIQCKRREDLGALIFVDLDNFKILNDTQGHRVGDLLLSEASARLQRCVRETDTVARLGGDEFVVVLETLSEKAEEAAVQAGAVAEKILELLAEPYQLEDHIHHSTASLGITLLNQTDASNDELLKQADVAMYHAKAAGRNAVRFFDPVMQATLAAQSALERDLRQAVEQHDLQLYYQPQVDSGGRTIGAEGLLRWHHPQRGWILPGEFIPVAELSDLILIIGRQVLKMACDQLMIWQGLASTRRLTLSINVSARQFRRSDFVAEVQAALRSSGADPRKLKLELTESMLLEDLDDCVAKMAQLKDLGIDLSLDDFGTGYSSLAYLKRLPLSQIKIDRSFVSDVLTNQNDATIARAIIVLGKSLGLAVIAEGVETLEQWAFLQSEGCSEAQGYLFGRPMPGEDFVRLAPGYHSQSVVSGANDSHYPSS